MRHHVLIGLLSAVAFSAAGPAVASAAPPDFDGDGFADLVVGVPNEDVGDVVDAGVVHVLYGAPRGPSVSRAQLFSQNTAGIENQSDFRDEFGAAVAWGDVDGDGRDDLAVGVPRETLGPESIRAGAVHLLFGSATGLRAEGSQLWHQNVPGVFGLANERDEFGTAVALGDVDGDGHADLASGVPGEAPGEPTFAGGEGAVSLLRGTATGLTADRDLLVTQDSPGAEDASEGGDFLGSPLTFADANGDGRSDLVVGIPREGIGDVDDAGAVQVIPGSAAGLDFSRDRFISQASPGIAGDPENHSQLAFGAALATGSFDADPFEDLAVGSPGEDEPTQGLPSGAVHVLYGSPNGIGTARAQRFPGEVPPNFRVYTGARFGFALAGADFDGDGIDDLAVGAPREETGREVPNASVISGAVFVFTGTPTGVTAAGRRVFHQNSPGVTDATENGDEFGQSLAAGAFDGDAAADLAVGVPEEDIGGVFDTGAVNVLRGVPGSGLSGSGGLFLHQSTPGVPDVSERADLFGFTLSGARPT